MKKKEELYSCSQQDHNAMAETEYKDGSHCGFTRL